jgi:hypothetical protein
MTPGNRTAPKFPVRIGMLGAARIAELAMAHHRTKEIHP